MNRKVIIASDSTCDLSKELIAKYDVKILPLHIIFGEDSYEDNVNMNLELSSCTLCPHMCKINRTNGKIGLGSKIQ